MGLTRYTERILGIVTEFIESGETDCSKLLDKLGEWDANDMLIAENWRLSLPKDETFKTFVATIVGDDSCHVYTLIVVAKNETLAAKLINNNAGRDVKYKSMPKEIVIDMTKPNVIDVASGHNECNCGNRKDY